MPAVRSGDKDKEAKTRSRAGCLTCRSRHKKCDETRLDEHRGACRRCFVGAWQCEWPTPPGEKPLKTFVRGVKASGADSEKPSKKERFVPRRLSGAGSETRSENEGGRGGDDEQMTDVRYTAAGPAPVQPYNNTGLEAVTAGFSLPGNASAGDSSGHALPDRPDQQPLPDASLPLPDFLTGRVPLEAIPTSQDLPFRPPPLTTPNPFADLDILAPASSLSAFLRPSVDTNDLTDFFNSLDAEAGFWDSLGGGLSSANGSAGAPSIAAESGPSPDAAAYSSGLTPHPNDVSLSSFALTMTPSTTSSAPSLLSSSRAHLVPSNQAVSSPSPSSHPSPAPSQSTSTELTADSKTATQQQSSVIQTLPVAIDEEGPPMVDPVAYNTFNQGFFRSLPKPVREVVVQRAYNAATSSELSRNASMAMVMLYRLRMQQQQQQQDPALNPSDLATTTEQQARLLAQSNLYFQRAIEHLQAPIPLEAKMVAVLDMQAYQFDQYGAAAANAILLLGEYFINEVLGPQPLLDLSAIRDSANVLLTVVAWSDCIRCICIPRRRTLFAFSNLPGEPAHSNSSSSSAVVDDVTSQPYDVNAHQGLPVGLMLCVAATANLACEMDALPDEVVRVKAQGIENAVREWKPPPPDAQDLADSAGYVEKVSTSEMWRHMRLPFALCLDCHSIAYEDSHLQAVIVFLYQVVHRHGPLSKPIRDAVQQILQIGVRMLNHHSPRPPPPASLSSSSSRAVSPPTGAPSDTNRASAPPSPSIAYDDYLSAPATRAVPWFLAGTCAILSGDRALCRRGLEVCGKQQGYRDNVMALERLWKIVDERGWVFDWREKLQEEKLLVGFL